jgi:hypothetical protein
MANQDEDSLSALAASAFRLAREAEPTRDVDLWDAAGIGAALNYLLLHVKACEVVIRKLASAVDELQTFDPNDPSI